LTKLLQQQKILRRIEHASTHGVGTGYSRATEIAHPVSTSLLFHCLIASCLFNREGEDDVLVACSCEEKYVVVDLLFWQLLLGDALHMQNKKIPPGFH
jgi:hypothetical protein